MDYALFAAARALHVLAGVFWVGSAVFMTYFLAPSLRRLPPNEAQKAWVELRLRGFPRAMFWAGTLVVAGGAYLLWSNPHPGPVLTAGSAAGFLSYLLSNLFIEPLLKKMARLGGAPSPPPKGTKDTPDTMDRLGRRLFILTHVNVLSQIVAVVTMVTFRYL
jgi:hypothetical protein